MSFTISAIYWYQSESMTWRRAPIGPSSLCRPIGVFPQIWWSREALSSGTHSENVLLSSWKLNRILQKHIQKLVYICGRANLSSNSLFGFVFIDLRTFENSASLSEGLRQPSHYLWIRRRQCYPITFGFGFIKLSYNWWPRTPDERGQWR